MSWDVFFVKLPDGVRSVYDAPKDYHPPPLGPRAELIAALRKLLGDADFSDPSWGQYLAEGFSIEFNMGGDPVDSLMLHVRGGEAAFGCVREIARALGTPAIDCSTGELIDFDAPDADASFRRWRGYRDRVIGGGS